MFLFDTFEPGKLIGTRTLTLCPDLVERWLMLYPDYGTASVCHLA